ncbi:MAG: ArsR family transcriptional regulator [Acidimicrobiaceae bacterium]|jgi:DNA-binding transcriptional ArsR family regulator|nr:ArsR family transcriptional regulator [Acidimicrobiaceae bacterium]
MQGPAQGSDRRASSRNTGSRSLRRLHSVSSAVPAAPYVDGPARSFAGLTRGWGQSATVPRGWLSPSLLVALRAVTALTYNHMVVDRPLENEIDQIFQALADATRRDILVRAIEQEQSVSALARHYDMSFAAVQKHVAVLERAALVGKQRRGREQIVHGNASTLRRATALLDTYDQLWIQRAINIADVLAGEEGDLT